MPKLVNRAKMTTATTGTGTITLGSAVDGYQTFAAAGVANADVVRYVIEDGDAWEIGLGTYTASGTTLTRGSIESSNADNPINLSGNAVVYVSAAAADLQELVDFADNFVLPTADGSTGQVLTTNGAGTLSFTTITGYTNADVDAHLNTSTAASGEVLSWTGSDYDWVTVAAGATDIDGLSDAAKSATAITLGNNSLLDESVILRPNGISGLTGNTSVAIGLNTGGHLNQTTAVGISAGSNLVTPSSGSSLFGSFAGYYISTGQNNTALGRQALWGNSGSKLTGSFNVGIGYQAGFNLSTGADNFLGGQNAGGSITTGSNNVAIGNGALDAATTPSRLVAIGQDALGALTTGTQNLGIGYGAGVAISTGNDNTFVGYQAGDTATTGRWNTVIGSLSDVSATGTADAVVVGYNSTATANAIVVGSDAKALGTGQVSIGDEAGRDSSTSSTRSVLIGQAAGQYVSAADNIAIGGYSLFSFGAFNLTGDGNIGIGYQTGYDLSTGSNNFLGGYQAGANITTGSNNIAIGNGALDAATTGGRNIAIGQDAMGLGVATAASGDNIAIGYQAGYDLTSGTDNILIGELAGANLTTGSGAVAVGRGALSSAATVGSATAVGFQALFFSNGFNATAFGYEAAYNQTTSGAITAIGHQAYYSTTSDADEGVAVGYRALYSTTNGRENTAVGHTSMNLNTTGLGNTAVGRGALLENTTGTNNTALGRYAGYNLTTGSNNILLGQSSTPSSATVSNEITLGNSSITTLRCQVTTITSLSDARDKTDIQPLNAGLEFVEALNPVSFTWNMRDGGKVGEADTGFIAQDLQKAQADTNVTIPGLVYDVNPDKLEAGYGKLIPVLVQAIKDLSAKVNLLEAQLEAK